MITVGFAEELGGVGFLQLDFRTHLDYISSSMGIVIELNDYHEGVRAFAEKRKPEFE